MCGILFYLGKHQYIKDQLKISIDSLKFTRP